MGDFDQVEIELRAMRYAFRRGRVQVALMELELEHLHNMLARGTELTERVMKRLRELDQARQVDQVDAVRRSA